MVKRVIVLTLGFDVRFQLRTLARLGPEGALSVLIVRPEGEEERAETAERELVEFAEKILGLRVEILRVPVDDPARAVAWIASRLSRYVGCRFVADLSGGMRALILETLAALLTVASPEALKIIVWFEDLRGKVEVSPVLFKLPRVDEDSLRILAQLGEGVPRTLRELATVLRMPRSTTYAKLRRLVELGLVRSRKDEAGRMLYEATQPGLAVLFMEEKLGELEWG